MRRAHPCSFFSRGIGNAGKEVYIRLMSPDLRKETMREWMRFKNSGDKK